MFTRILEAAKRIDGVARRTPVMTSRTINRGLGCEVFFKCENFQCGGAFKFRGAYNAISLLDQDQKDAGVITYSSGNHAQAVALTGRLLALNTVLVMPENAPETKRAAAEGYGATVVTYDPQTEVREAVAAGLREEDGYTLIPPFDHEDVIAGQGTAALELFDEVGELDMLLVPCGGGGLLCGSAITARNRSPNCKVIGIEPELADDATRSFRTGKLHCVTNPPTIADGTRTTSMGQITFPLALEYVNDMQTVSEEAIIAAVRYLFFRMKIVVEPAGVLGLAALQSGAVPPRGRIGVILSGGNIDAPTMTRILGS